jgi:hypothetical protein
MKFFNEENKKIRKARKEKELRGTTMKKVNTKSKEETLDAKTWETNLAPFKQQHGKITKYKKVDNGEAYEFLLTETKHY